MSRLRFRFYALGVFLAIVAASLHALAPELFPILRLPLPYVADEYMSRQGQTLRPDFRTDLKSFAELPRYHLDVRVEVISGVIRGTMALDYTNRTGSPLDELVFRLYPNARTIYGGGSLSVENVRRGDTATGTRLSADRTVLTMALSPPLAPGETTSVSLSFTAQVPAVSQGYRIYHRGRDVTSLAAWYPILTMYRGGWQTPPIPSVGDALLAEPSSHEITLTLPAGYEVVASGTTLSTEETAAGTRWHLASGPARSMTLVLSNRFERLQTQAEGVTINLYTLPAGRASTSAEATLRIAAESFACYSRRFGVYPFTEFDLVETPVSIGGYEFAGLVSLEHDLRVRGNREYYRFIVAHEVAHQWWYMLVGNDQIMEPWLDESLATYSTIVYLEDAIGPEAARALQSSFEREYGRPAPGRPPITSPTLAFNNWLTYRTPVYYHGALFLAALRQQIGDERFFALLQRYVADYRFRTATSPDFLNLVRRMAGADVEPLIAAWFGPQAPRRLGGPSER